MDVPTSPYGSAADLPSVVELDQRLEEFQAFAESVLVDDAVREQIASLETQRHRVVSIVDRFYELLGPRNWVFTDYLVLDEVEDIIDTADVDVAERRLIDYYKSDRRIDSQLLLLNTLPFMRPRRALLDKALADYREGRYYSTVLVLLTVMDGFVNDTDRQNGRKNLNSRDPSEMVSWDSVAGHHMGLSHAHRTFNAGVYKTTTDPATELLRNGILHGMVIDFDNDIVATKAWNRLFAVADWARACQKQSHRPEPTPTASEVAQAFLAQRETTQRLARWRPHEHTISPNPEGRSDIDRTCLDFLQRWQNQQWALVGKHFHVSGATMPDQKRAVKTKRLYGRFALTSWSVDRIHHKGAALAEAHVRLIVNDAPFTAVMKWLYTDGQGGTFFDWQDGGLWRLFPYWPSLFLTEAT
ncbi:hypothetical protein [Rhodococcus sp. B50]|uniref:hypothetical protein n=1 Tax=Rhodococcus sp. B50 TaxID=2682847 RepID=UPI001BD63AD1|nr:hypothetical protein [Rhodococcus sp. B50]